MALNGYTLSHALLAAASPQLAPWLTAGEHNKIANPYFNQLSKTQHHDFSDKFFKKKFFFQVGGNLKLKKSDALAVLSGAIK